MNRPPGMTGLRGGRYVALIALALLVVAPARAAAWSCASGGYRVHWTSANITAGAIRGMPGSGFSVRRFAAASFALLRQEMRVMHAPGVSMRRRFTVVSLIGPLLGLRDEASYSYARAAHPGGETRYWTIDLRRHGALALSRYDPFAIDPSVPDVAERPELALDRLASPPPPQGGVSGRRDRGWRGFLDKAEQHARNRTDACLWNPPDSLYRFAITGADRGSVAIVIGFPGEGDCRDNLTEISLRLPRGALRPAFRSALSAPVCVPPVGMTPVALYRSAGSGGMGDD